MYLKHVRLYKRHSNLKKSKRRLTLNHFDAVFRCNALILKMARLRFPGRPGQRIGKTYVKYVHDDVKMNVDPCVLAYNKIQVGLKLFYELFGYSDEEEEEFEGFTDEDLIEAESALARKLKTKDAIHRYLLDSSQELSCASDFEKLLSSSDSDTSSSSSVRQKRGMRDILRRSYDKILKHGLDMESNSMYSNKSNKSSNLKKVDENKSCDFLEKSSFVKIPSVNTSVAQHDNLCTYSKPSLEINPKETQQKHFVKHLVNKTNKLKPHCGRRRSLRPNVKKKYRKHFLYSSKKYSKSIKKITRSSTKGKQINRILKCRQWTKSTDIPEVQSKSKSDINPLSVDTTLSSDQKLSTRLKHSSAVGRKNVIVPSVSSYSSKSENKVDSCSSQMSTGIEVAPKQRRLLSRKRFILPSMSARSSRKIIPRKRYIDESERSLQKIANEDSQGSQSSLSGSSETISAMDGESSPDDTQPEESSENLMKVGLLDQPLVVEGKRPWKPSLKVQMKLSEMNCDYPFALKKNMDGSSGTSSGSFKDIIKPDMVSKYAEKMAKKPKEKPLKVVECTKKYSVHSVNEESEETENDYSDTSEGPKKGDKLKKVAAKIEKLLKSQWEGRLKNSAQPTNKISSEIVAHWKTEQQQRNSNQRRTKSILRKARLQLKKRNSNLRTRQSVKQIAESDEPAERKVQSSAPGISTVDQSLQNVLGVPSIIDESSLVADCVICGSSQIHISTKTYQEATCETCDRFFKGFLKTPKQYFCKDGNCYIGSKAPTPRRPTNSRCKACWIKACIEKLTVSPDVKQDLLQHVPRYDDAPHNSLIAVEENEDLPIEGTDVMARGPRIKHVCRRAAVVLGLPRATFSDISEPMESFNLSALPEEEKQKLLESVPEEEAEDFIFKHETKVSNPSKVLKHPVKKKVHREVKAKNKVHLDLLKKSTLFICNEQKKKKLQMKKSTKHLHKRSFKKSLKLGRKSQMKKTVKFSYKSAVKTSMESRPQILPKRLDAKPVKFRKVRCKECEGCLADDCAQCAYCLDKKKFGGPNLIKQACMYRRCLRPVLPASERRASKMSFSLHIDKSKDFGGHSSFGGDGPSGIGRSLSSSSSSPSSLDGSSCGSSCTSSSSSSSSGSSGSSSSSSSSSNSSSSSSSSSSNNVSASNSLLINNCVKSSLMPNFESQSVILHQSECIDNNVAIFPDSMYTDSSFASEPTLHDLLSQKAIFGDANADNCDFKENVDTILYEDSSSIIELKNASYTPSLIYGASLGDESSSYSSNSGSKSDGSQSRTCKRSQYIDKDHYGSAGSGSNGDDNEDDDDDDNKKHFILADYWEDYDFERISSQGFALISSQQISLPCVCYLCGSAGQEKLIFCVLCCEPYHTFCLSDDDVPSEENIENWCCKRCQSCAVCGSKNNLLKCKKCQNTYHAECLAPHYPTKPSRKKRIWVCPKCVKCKSCGATASSLNSGQIWNFDSLLCHPCSKLTDKGIESF